MSFTNEDNFASNSPFYSYYFLSSYYFIAIIALAKVINISSKNVLWQKTL